MKAKLAVVFEENGTLVREYHVITLFIFLHAIAAELQSLNSVLLSN